MGGYAFHTTARTEEPIPNSLLGSNPVAGAMVPPGCSLKAAMTVGLVSVWVLLLSGPCFGFNSLYPVLYSESLFIDICGDDRAAECQSGVNFTQHGPCCDQQSARMTTLSTVTLFAEDGVLLLYGELQDRAGARCGLIVAVFIMLCALGMLVVNSLLLDIDLLWYGGFFLMGLSGPGIFLSALSLGEKFDGLEPIITPIITAMFDASSLVFLLWSVLYNGGGGVAFSTILISWLVLAAVRRRSARDRSPWDARAT